jgi:hypothetical protein
MEKPTPVHVQRPNAVVFQISRRIDATEKQPPADSQPPNDGDVISPVESPVLESDEEQVKETCYAEDKLTQGRKTAIAVFLILSNSILVRIIPP